MDHDKRPKLLRCDQRLEQCLIISLELVFIGHEDFKRSDSFLLRYDRQLLQHTFCHFNDLQVKAVIDNRLVLRLVMPSLYSILQRNSLARQAEVNNRRCSPESRCPGSRFIIIFCHGAAKRHIQMGMRINSAREDIASFSINNFCLLAVKPASNLGDYSVIDFDICLVGIRSRYDCSIFDDFFHTIPSIVLSLFDDYFPITSGCMALRFTAAWRSFHVIGGSPDGNSIISMASSTGQTMEHRLQPTQSSSLTLT